MTFRSQLNRSSHRRSAFTLLELVISIAISAMLVVGLTSVIMTSMKTLRMHESGAAKTTDLFKLSSQICGDIKLATKFTELDSGAIEFAVLDRDGDDRSELIRYSFRAELNRVLKTIDFSGSDEPPVPAIIAEDVSQFDLAYLARSFDPPIDPIVESDDLSLLYSSDDAPEGDGTALLLVVQNEFGMSTQETLKKTFFESVGFTVTTIDQNATTTQFSSAVAANDLIYLSSEVDPSIDPTKFGNVEIGIVSENVPVSESLGLGVATTTPELDWVCSIVEDRHFISAETGFGSVPVYAAAQSVLKFENDPQSRAGGLISLADWLDGSALCIVNKDDSLLNQNGATGVFGNQNLGLPDKDDPIGLPGGNIGGNTNTNTPDYHNDQLATPVTLSVAGNVKSISAYLTVTGTTDVRFGIYADDNGQPGELLAETDEEDLTAHSGQWYTFDLLEEVELPAGAYWLSIGFDDDVSFSYSSVLGQTYFSDANSDPTGSGLMDPWAGLSTIANEAAAIYANYEELAVAAGRRVQLPWGDGSWDFAQITSASRSLLENCLMWAGDQTPNIVTVDHAVSQSEDLVHCFQATGLPQNVDAWSIGRVAIMLRRNKQNLSGAVQFSLYLSDGSGQPTGSPIAQTSFISTTQFPTESADSDEWVWFEIPFERTNWIEPTSEVCLVVAGASATEDAFIGTLSQPSVTGGNGGPITNTGGSGGVISAPGEIDALPGNGELDPAGELDPLLLTDPRMYVFGTFRTTGEPTW